MADEIFPGIPFTAAGAEPLTPPAPPMPPPMGMPPSIPSAPPVPPPPGPVANDPHQKLLALAALAAAIAGGRQSGLGGLPLGVQAGQAHLDAARQKDYEDQQKYQQAQATLIDRQQIAQQAQLQQRQRVIEGALASVAKTVPTLQTKDEYDRFIDMAGNTLTQSGYRIGPNQLRANYPYVAPNAQGRADKALDEWMKNPFNKQLIEKDPQRAAASKIAFDRAGQGFKADISIDELATIAGRPFGKDPTTGAIVPIPAAEHLSGAEAMYFDAALEQMKADGLNVTDPKVRAKAAEQAQKRSKEASAPPPDEAVAPERVASTAQAILEHRMAPSQLSLGGGMGKAGVAFKQAVLAEVNRQDPHFDFQAAESNYTFGKSAGTQSTVRYIDNIAKTIPMLRQANQVFQRSNVQTINQVLRSGKAQFGNVNVADFDFKLGLIQDELAKTLQGGGTGSATSDAKLRQAQTLIGPNMSPAQLETVLNAAQEMLKVRRESLTTGTYMDRGGAPAGVETWGRDANGKLVRQP